MVTTLSSVTCPIIISTFSQSKNVFEGIFICRICVWATDYNVKKKILSLEFIFQLHLMSTRSFSTLYSILHLILLYPLSLRPSQHLTTFYDIQTCNSKLLSHHKSYSVYHSHKTHSNFRMKVNWNHCYVFQYYSKIMRHMNFICCICMKDFQSNRYIHAGTERVELNQHSVSILKKIKSCSHRHARPS